MTRIELWLDTVGESLSARRSDLASTTKVAQKAANRANDKGVTEVEIAKRLGVDRMTVRRWLGKR